MKIPKSVKEVMKHIKGIPRVKIPKEVIKSQEWITLGRIKFLISKREKAKPEKEIKEVPKKEVKVEKEKKLKIEFPKIKLSAKLRKYKSELKNKVRQFVSKLKISEAEKEMPKVKPSKPEELEIKRLLEKEIKLKKRIKLSNIGKTLGRYKRRLINKIRLVAKPKVPEKPKELKIREAPKKEVKLKKWITLGEFKQKIISQYKILVLKVKIPKPEKEEKREIEFPREKAPKIKIMAKLRKYKKRFKNKVRQFVSRPEAPKSEEEMKWLLEEKVKPPIEEERKHEMEILARLVRKYKTKLINKIRSLKVRIRKLKGRE